MEQISETDRYINYQLQQNGNDVDQNISSLLSTKYYGVNAFQQLDNSNNLNIFHSNVNSLESKFDILSEFLDGSKSDLDIVGITETSEKNDTSFISNVSLPGYTLFHTPTNTRNGGTALYVKSIYNPFERFDLKIQDDDV